METMIVEREQALWPVARLLAEYDPDVRCLFCWLALHGAQSWQTYKVPRDEDTRAFITADMKR